MRGLPKGDEEELDRAVFPFPSIPEPCSERLDGYVYREKTCYVIPLTYVVHLLKLSISVLSM